MSRELKLARGLALPADVAGQTVAIVGIRGSGKTNTAGVIAEELLDLGHPAVIIDPTDCWWGIRSDYPVLIFGGSHGDIPLAEGDGKTIAEFVVTEQAPLILSLRHLRKGAQRRFVTEFCEELYHLKGEDKYRSPLTVFIDEAPLFVPQRVTGDVARTVGAVEDLIARGRNSGFGVVLISQRSATLNKDVLTQSDTIIAHRLPSPQDRKALSEWIEENATVAEHKEVLASLAKMANGQAWVWAPKLDVFKQVQIRMRRTFDSSASPKIGEKLTPPKKLTDIDIAKLKGKLAEALERRKAEDPALLRKRIDELEHASVGVPRAELETEYRRGYGEGQESILAELQPLFDSLGKHQGVIVDALSRIQDAVRDFSTTTRPTPSRRTAALQIVDDGGAEFTGGRLRELPPHNHSAGGGTAGNTAFVGTPPHALVHQDAKDALPSGERATLIAIAQHRHGVTREQLCILTGYKSSTRNAYIQRLRERNFVFLEGDTVLASAEGLGALGPDFEPLPTGEELRDHWIVKLPDGEKRIFHMLCTAYPDALERDYLQRVTSYARSSTNAYIQRLKSRKLVTIIGRGSVKAAAELFA